MTDAPVYFTGKSCKHGHVANRFVRNRTCVECARGHRKTVDPEKLKAQKRKSYIKNGEKIAAKRLADYWVARVISERTGIKHEVDHKIPLSRGGLHHPDNLQILTKAKNRQKTNKTPEEFACL